MYDFFNIHPTGSNVSINIVPDCIGQGFVISVQYTVYNILYTYAVCTTKVPCLTMNSNEIIKTYRYHIGKVLFM